MTSDKNSVQLDRQRIIDAKAQGVTATIGTYTRLSGPGWLQSAITLGGGSLASSLYLGVLGGFALMWLQPLAMILGIVMLSAISYVSLSTGERPFRAINQHINPVLGWGWAIATLMANLVWSLPQFSLGTAAVRQNLFPSVFGAGAMPDTNAKLIVGGAIMLVCICIAWAYNSGNLGVKIFNIVLKLMVGLIVLCFFGVVIRMSMGGGQIRWGEVLHGFVPDFRLLSAPAASFNPLIADVAPAFRDYWSGLIVGQQRDVMISAAATAVGINMTFLLPYSMLRRGWDREFRGLAVFDLSTGLFVPFLVATSCVVIASAAQFHTQAPRGLLEGPSASVEVPGNISAGYEKLALKRVEHELGPTAFAALTDEEKQQHIEALPKADKYMAAVLVKRDAFNLANSLSDLTGEVFSHYVFGIGVVGMAVSSIIILMLINGFVVCEMLGKPWAGWPFRLGTLMPCIGIIGPFIWGGAKAQFWLAIPTSVFGMVLLPVAYLTFFLLINKKSILGADLPRGGKRILWNVLMVIAIAFALLGSLWSLWSKLEWIGVAIAASFLGLALIVQMIRSGKGK
jgi:Mn2+/Fe2+ NRAMP family transporter